MNVYGHPFVTTSPLSAISDCFRSQWSREEKTEKTIASPNGM